MANIQAASEAARYRGFTDERPAEKIQYFEAYLAKLQPDVANGPLHRAASAELVGARAEQKRRRI